MTTGAELFAALAQAQAVKEIIEAETKLVEVKATSNLSEQEQQEFVWLRANRALVEKLMSGEWVAVPSDVRVFIEEAIMAHEQGRKNAVSDYLVLISLRLTATLGVPRAQTDGR